jgi:hypothetical protein
MGIVQELRLVMMGDQEKGTQAINSLIAMIDE